MTTSSSSNSGGSSATTIIDLLRKACTNEILPLSNNSSLSEDGNILTIYEDGSSYDATSLITVTVRDGKSSTTTSTKDVTYSLASIYLQLLHPEDVLTYRKACGHYKVKDPVKVLDKNSISEYFCDGGNDVELLPPLTTTTTTTTTTDSGAEKEDFKDDAAGDDDDDDAMDYDDLSGDDADVDAAGKASSSSKRRTKEGVLEDKKRPRSGSSSNSKSRGRDNKKLHHGESSSSRKKHSSKSSSQQREDEDRRIGSSSSSKGKAPKGPITNEQLVANLSTIVDKRDIGGGLVMGTPTKAAKVATTRTSTTTTNDEDDTNEATGPTTTTTGFTPTTPATTPMLSDDEQGQQQGGFSQNSTTDEVDAMMILGSSTTTTTTSDYDRDLLLAWLSPEGFQVDSSPSVAAAIEADREAVRRITALEIPVGDSASILRAGAGGEIAVDKSGTELTGVAHLGEEAEGI